MHEGDSGLWRKLKHDFTARSLLKSYVCRRQSLAALSLPKIFRYFATEDCVFFLFVCCFLYLGINSTSGRPLIVTIPTAIAFLLAQKLLPLLFSVMQHYLRMTQLSVLAHCFLFIFFLLFLCALCFSVYPCSPSICSIICFTNVFVASIFDSTSFVMKILNGNA